MPQKIIIFDADGMVITEERFSIRFPREFHIDTQLVSAFMDHGFKECILGKKDLKEELPTYFKSWNYTKSVDALIAYWFNDAKLNSEIAQLATQLRQKNNLCILATNQEKYRIRFLREQFALDSLFDKEYVSSEIGYKKPRKDFFDFIIKDLQIEDRQNVMFWDDRPEYVEKGRLYGFDSRLYTTVEDFKHAVQLYLP